MLIGGITLAEVWMQVSVLQHCSHRLSLQCTWSQRMFRLSFLLLSLYPQWNSFAAMPPFSSILLTTPLCILSKTLGTPASREATPYIWFFKARYGSHQ